MGLHIVGEGHGERDALPLLVRLVSEHLDLVMPDHDPEREGWAEPLITQAHVLSACARARQAGDCDALLLTRDADNEYLPEMDCPKVGAPELAGWVRALSLPFPAAVVLFYREYETLFLAGAGGMAGRMLKDGRGQDLAMLPPDASSHPQPEHLRDAKGWVRKNLVVRYKATLHQAPLTAALDLADPGLGRLASYVHLVAGLRFVSSHQREAGAVYPPPAGVETGG